MGAARHPPPTVFPQAAAKCQRAPTAHERRPFFSFFYLQKKHKSMTILRQSLLFQPLLLQGGTTVPIRTTRSVCMIEDTGPVTQVPEAAPKSRAKGRTKSRTKGRAKLAKGRAKGRAKAWRGVGGVGGWVRWKMGLGCGYGWVVWCAGSLRDTPGVLTRCAWPTGWVYWVEQLTRA